MSSFDGLLDVLDIQARVAAAYPGAEWGGARWSLDGDMELRAFIGDDVYVSEFIDGKALRIAQRGGDMKPLMRAVEMSVDALIENVRGGGLSVRYDYRPRPKLGAGTAGYARRKR